MFFERYKSSVVHVYFKEGDRMKKGVIIAAVLVLFVIGSWPADNAAAETLKGRVWAHWAENPDGEVLFGIQYWNTGQPGSGKPGGRSSVATTAVPEGPSGGGAWGFQGQADQNAPYAGWYHAQTTVRLAVKDKNLMDQITKANQELVNLEVNVEDIGGRPTITSFKVLK
jgi:hypothetical protein